MEQNKNSVRLARIQSKTQTKVIAKAQKECNTVHFATLMVLCQLKHSDLDKKFRVCRVTW